MKKIEKIDINKVLKNNSDLCIQEDRGITLIALIVTIIVLLLLAGVGISMIVGDNGILTKAQKSSECYKTAENIETSNLNTTNDIIEQCVNGKKVPIPLSEISVGDYIKYTANSYSNWRVFSINNQDDVYTIKLISEKCTQTKDLRSYYVGGALSFLNTTTNWQSYVNGIADSAVGAPTYSEINSAIDSIKKISQAYWIQTTYSTYCIYIMNASNNYAAGDVGSCGISSGIRPVVTLKNNLEIVNGDGSTEKPWEMQEK